MKSGFELISDETFVRVARAMIADHEIPKGRAARILDQALAFVGAYAAMAVSGEIKQLKFALWPSPEVDLGWEALEGDPVYLDLAIDLTYWVRRRPAETFRSQRDIRRTAIAVEHVGFVVRPEFWPGDEPAELCAM